MQNKNKLSHLIQSMKFKVQQLNQRNDQLVKTKKKKYKQLVNTLNKFKELHPTIESNLDKLIDNYNNTLEMKPSNKCSLKQLTTYLKSEKQLSLQIIDYLGCIETQQLAKYHELIKNNQYNLLLSQLSLKRLQDQIQYIKNNVMSGKTFIFKSEEKPETITPQDIKKQLQQLGRVIHLNTHCKRDCPKQIPLIIKSQYNRQKQAYEMISTQIKVIAEETNLFKKLKLQNIFKQQIEITDQQQH